ncbi:MAG: hypothetical protein F6K41_23520 [Symploca sp. SIO3E6]|nr:hypothetical protein [Caldora sp. SIO3E6]
MKTTEFIAEKMLEGCIAVDKGILFQTQVLTKFEQIKGMINVGWFYLVSMEIKSYR